MTEVLSGPQLLPPPLIHDLRTRSSARIFRMTGNPGNRGFGSFVRRRVTVMVQREHTLVQKAVTVSYLGSFLVDHIVQAEKLACRLIERREMSEVEEHRSWEKKYGEVIVKLLRETAGGDAIQEFLPRLENYSVLPPSLYKFRQRHWRRLDKWFHIRHQAGPAMILTHVAKVLDGRRSGDAKARSIRIAASLLADIECWLDHVPWPDAYRHVMTDFYPAIAKYPDVLEALV